MARTRKMFHCAILHSSGFQKKLPRKRALQPWIVSASRTQVKHIDVSFNGAGEPTIHGSVEVCSGQHVRLLPTTTKKNGFEVLGINKMSIKVENTDIDKNQNWALDKANKTLKEDDRCFGNTSRKNAARSLALRSMGSPLSCGAKDERKFENL